MKLLSCFLLLIQASLVKSWQPLGSTAIIAADGFSSLGSVVDLSHDGRRVAVGSPDAAGGNGSISLFELDGDATSWNLLATISGASGEGLGDFLSLSPDGLFIAVRHHFPDAVQVYQIKQDQSLETIGSEKVCPNGSDGQSLLLRQALSTSSSLGGAYWLVIGCEGYDNDRGKVHVYELHDGKAGYHWSPSIGHLTGVHPGARFGSQTAFTQAPSSLADSGRVVRLAVSSPMYNSGQGLVQVFDGDLKTGWSQHGGDLVGEQIGELFGASLDMSSTEYPYLIVGSPKHTRTSGITDGAQEFHGMARLFHWRSPVFTSPPTPPAWHLVGSPIEGIDHGDKFGRSVSMSKDGNRFAISSHTYYGVYELQNYASHSIVSSLLHSPDGSSKTTIALSDPGSVIISTFSHPTGYEVSALIDESSFCQIPKADPPEDDQVISEFLERATCRSYGVNLLSTEEKCARTSVFFNGEFVFCEWTHSYVTEHPTVTPSSFPTRAVSTSPTARPSLSSSSPTKATDNPTNEDSLEPTLAPSATIFPNPSNPGTSEGPVASSNPTFEPSLAEVTEAPTLGFPSTPPSHSPVAIPSLPTLEPSTTPSIQDQNLNSSDPTGTPTASPTNLQPVIDAFPSEIIPKPTLGGLNMLNVCRCDEDNVCSKTRFNVDSGDLRICVKKEEGANFLISGFDEFKLKQGNINTTLIQDSQILSDDIENTCSDDQCIMEMPVSGEMFLEERAPHLWISGVVSVSSFERRNLRSISHRNLDDQTFVRFGTILLLERKGSSSGGNSEVEAASLSDEQSSDWTEEWWMLFPCLAVLALIGLAVYRKQARKRGNGNANDGEDSND